MLCIAHLGRILESDSGYWRSVSKPDESALRSAEWIVCQFSSAVTLSSIELKWRAGFLPDYFSLSVSRGGVAYDTVAVVVITKHESRILVPKVRQLLCAATNEAPSCNLIATLQGKLVTSIKITMFSSDTGGKQAVSYVFGIVLFAANVHLALYQVNRLDLSQSIARRHRSTQRTPQLGWCCGMSSDGFMMQRFPLRLKFGILLCKLCRAFCSHRVLFVGFCS